MKLIIDTLGSDNGYEEIVKGVIEAASTTSMNFVLVGPEKEIRKIIYDSDIDINRFEFLDTNEFISNDDEPVKSIRRKTNSSTVLGLNKLNEDGYDGYLSCGSTGATLAGGLFITKRIENVQRAVISAALPTTKGSTILVDTGAVMDSTPVMQQQFAIMGSIYAQRVLGKDKPSVYLLNVGTEEGKGDIRTKKVYDLLKETEGINFQGNIEARNLMSGMADVIVSDGFAGNIALKSIEGMAGLIFKELKDGIMKSKKNKLGALLIKDVFKEIGKRYNYKEVGSALLLGVKKPVFKAHGSSDSKAVKSAVLNAEKIINKNIIQYIEEEFEKW